MRCAHCGDLIGVTVVYDQGKRYHPDCYAVAHEQKLREMVKKTLGRDDWQKGLYES